MRDRRWTSRAQRQGEGIEGKCKKKMYRKEGERVVLYRERDPLHRNMHSFPTGMYIVFALRAEFRRYQR